MIKLFLEAFESIHDQQQNVMSLSSQTDFAYTYTLRDCANPFRKWRIYSKVKMLNCIFGDQVKKQNFSTFHLHIFYIDLGTVEPRFNEVAGDQPNLFVKWRVRHIENLDIMNLRENDQNVCYIEVIVND